MHTLKFQNLLQKSQELKHVSNWLLAGQMWPVTCFYVARET